MIESQIKRVVIIAMVVIAVTIAAATLLLVNYQNGENNKNTNGLLRYFFPKKSSFATLTQEELDQSVYLLNTRPRKRLNWRTPAQMLKV